MPEPHKDRGAPETDVLRLRPSSCAVLLDIATPQLYRENPFRKVGLPVLAGPRDVAKRIDQLKLSAELDTGALSWSFAPEIPLTVDQIREVAQALKEPAGRLVHELFWFWPEHYPDDTSADAAINHLAQGETALAVECWEAAAISGQPAAVHNLAVYYHQQVLALESRTSADEQELIQLWFKALRYWDRIAGSEGVWTRVQARVDRMADARLTGELVRQIRANLPQALAKICAALALSHGEQGRADRAALHAALVIHIHGDTVGPQRVLEACATPIARRIDDRVRAATNRVRPQAATGLAAAIALIRNNDEDLRLIEMLCGRTAEFYHEVSHSVAGAGLGCLVAYQRQTADDCGCLPVLLYLLGMETTPELKRRLADTFEVVYRNALSGKHHSVEEAPRVAVTETTSDFDRSYRLLAAEVIPGMEKFGLGGVARQEYASRIAGMLQQLAITACNETGNMALATNAFATALELPCSPEVRAGLEKARAKLQRDFTAREEEGLRAETEGSHLLVNQHGVCLNGTWTSPAEIAALRHGTETRTEGGAVVTTYLIAWRNTSGEVFVLNHTNLFPPSDSAAGHFASILDSFYASLVPGLVDRLVRTIRAGEEVFLGETPLKPEGMLLGSPADFWKRDELVPYAMLETKMEGGQLILSSKNNPWRSETHDVAQTWNAAIITRVIEALLCD
jgi:hypothetical protein